MWKPHSEHSGNRAIGPAPYSMISNALQFCAPFAYLALQNEGELRVRIFASWSGDESRQIAELFKAWIPSVIQDAEVYVSSQDIGKGERWQASVSNSLAEIDFGVIIVTKTNVNAPWILFEAGALSKSVKGIVVPLLCGVENFEAAKSPLTQFQYARVVEEEMRDLVLQINTYLAKPLDQARVERAFAKWWPDFISGYEAIELPDDKPAKKETDNARLTNIEAALSEVMIELRRMRTANDILLANAKNSGAVGVLPTVSELNDAGRFRAWQRRQRELMLKQETKNPPETQSE